jgi:ATP-dependent Lon protease
MDNNFGGDKKKNRNYRYVINFYSKITLLTRQIEFLFRNKIVCQDFYIENMSLLNDSKNRVIHFEDLLKKKRNIKSSIENNIKEINVLLEDVCSNIGSDSCHSIIDIFTDLNEFIDNKDINYRELLSLYNDNFTPLSCKLVIDYDKFIKKHNIQNITLPIVIKLIEGTKTNQLFEKINGATIVIILDKNRLLYINGYFNKDSLNIFKNLYEFKEKTNIIQEKIEYVEIPNDFKEKYLEQISLRDFILYTPDEIINIVKTDYNEFLNYKNKSLSALIKEFIKSNIEKQRRIIILFLISEQEYQFTAHIIFDLITDKSFLSESQYLSDILFNSLHWKIQKIFKVSQENFEENKKKLENININNVPYESRILAIKASDNVKSKAMDKLKEINGSKENSIKAQQWLDGFLKIPFNINKNEPIIDFFKVFQIKIEKFIDTFTIKISEYKIEKLNNKNKCIYNIIIQIIDEYHSNINKSEYSYSNYIKYLELIILTIDKKIGLVEISKNETNSNENIFSLPNESTVLDCIKQFNHIKNIKNELIENKILNNNNWKTMANKLDELESMLNINIINNDTNDDINEENNYDINFKKYIIRIIDEINNFIKEWNNFKLKKKNYMKKVDNILDKCTYGQIDAKKQMKRIIGQWMNGNSKGQCFGLCGPPGVGKTTLCKNGLAKCLFDENGEDRPFAFLPLGGATNGSILEGHHYTYLGSTWGKIVDILMETKCMNPIIYIDELDKISKTEHGKEIVSILTHITDQSQNKEFYDRYFASIPIDLSQILFIFSYNDKDNIDRILRDRIQEITIKPLSVNEKLVICQDYIIPEILTNVGFSTSEIIFNNEILTTIINKYTYEAGMRKLNEILYDIIREINLKKIEDDNEILEYPLIIDNNLIKDILSKITPITSQKIYKEPRIGIGLGLYAVGGNIGLGGLTIIQVMKTYSEKKFSLEKLTGSLGDVMKESVTCSMTVAWNILPDEIKNKINDSKDGFGLHIHCGDGGTNKDGPSAGIVICLAIISRLTNIPIKNDVAMTGEIDLQGNSCEIGGLYSKLQGAYDAGVKKVLVPINNEKDLDIIFKKENDELKEMKKVKSKLLLDTIIPINNENYNKVRIFRNDMEVYTVSNIFEVLEHALVKNDLVFKTFD